MAKERELPPPLEMACLNALWELGEGNVEEVRLCVSRARPLAYTTVLTLLDRLSRRGAVSRRKEGRGFRYQPSIDRDKLRRLALGQFLDHHFSGSVANLQVFLELETLTVTALEETELQETELPEAQLGETAPASIDEEVLAVSASAGGEGGDGGATSGTWPSLATDPKPGPET